MTKVKITIESDCSVWRADLHSAHDDLIVSLPNINATTTIELKSGGYYISIASFGNPQEKAATITVSTSGSEPISEVYGPSDDGTMLVYFGFSLRANGEIA